jgi:hypothetical protein
MTEDTATPTIPETAEDYRALAEKARRLALATTDSATTDLMNEEAADCEEAAIEIEKTEEAALASEDGSSTERLMVPV